MTTQQAKKIPLSILLEKLGFLPAKSKSDRNDVWFTSPFRPQETEASFHINVRKNVWYDFRLNDSLFSTSRTTIDDEQILQLFQILTPAWS